jgi:hypothetical protein
VLTSPGGVISSPYDASTLTRPSIPDCRNHDSHGNDGVSALLTRAAHRRVRCRCDNGGHYSGMGGDGSRIALPRPGANVTRRIAWGGACRRTGGDGYAVADELAAALNNYNSLIC